MKIKLRKYVTCIQFYPKSLLQVVRGKNLKSLILFQNCSFLIIKQYFTHAHTQKVSAMFLGKWTYFKIRK